MKYLLIVKCHSNSGDIVYGEYEVDEEEFKLFIEKINKLLPILKSKCYSWNNSIEAKKPDFYRNMYRNLMSEDDIEFIYNILPFGEEGISTIKSIEYCEFKPRTRIL